MYLIGNPTKIASQETIDVLLHKVILRYVKMGGCQYLRDYRMALRLKKTAELRKRVLQRNKKNAQKNDSVPFQVRKYVQRQYRELTDNKSNDQSSLAMIDCPWQ